MQLEDYFDFLAPDDIRIKGHRIGIETVLYEYIYHAQTPESPIVLIRLCRWKKSTRPSLTTGATRPDRCLSRQLARMEPPHPRRTIPQSRYLHAQITASPGRNVNWLKSAPNTKRHERNPLLARRKCESALPQGFCVV